ncbi:protein ULTRAPETALA 2-like [Prosopis cineraria]|uniref:protein ULTRAPETALA 2-like n=1 Tax=Prosopis cineraria TaxID=364024 RepID=UPI00240EDDD4|nr:protein ULTRAPETALA 2-like [Prosopis cineraria]
MSEAACKELRAGKGNRTVGKSKRKRFNEEELKGIRGYEKGLNYVEVGCGFTNKKYGDFGGKLRIEANVDVTPKEFEKHGGMKEVKGRKWTSSIWVQVEDTGERLALGKSKVMKYYNHKANAANWIKHASRNNKFHNDLFIRCSNCHKQRRFRRRTMKQIKDYHDAVNNTTWECSLWPYDNYINNKTLKDQIDTSYAFMLADRYKNFSCFRITCEDEEERDNRKMYRGCPLVKQCPGCKYCNCTGCLKCRFLNCNCRECTDL